MTALPGREQPPLGEGGTPSAMDALRLRRLNRWQAETLKEDLADLYVESSRAQPGEGYRDREAFLRRLTGAVRRLGRPTPFSAVSGGGHCVADGAEYSGSVAHSRKC